jgi:ribosomal protein S18 acetylase RimI-like enzyme
VKPYEPAEHREQAHQVLREMLSRGPVPYTPHPGDWDWWTFHADPRDRTVQLIGAGALAAVSSNEATKDDGELAAFGLRAAEMIELGRTILPGSVFKVSHVSVADNEHVEVLRAAGFELDGPPSPLFERETASASPTPIDGFEIRSMRGEQEHVARADAARLAFSSTLGPDVHRARYLRFMRSPAYVLEHDMVAVAPDGTIASFVIYWPDDQLSLAQFEPVGTHPDYQRRGLARAVLQESLARLAAAGIKRARVMTGGGNERAASTYVATGFDLVDQVAAYRAPASFGLPA